jgi:hypothetical protein
MKKSSTKTTNTLIVMFIIITSFLTLKAIHNKSEWRHMPAYVLGPIFLFGIVTRRSAWAKPYFTSKYNIFSAKIRYQQEFDLPKHLLFEKLLEMMPEAGFKIRKADEDSGDIFATTPLTWTSWGENIYIELKEMNGKTTMDFCSACLFQLSSWGKNESNYDNFMDEFEKSLTI